MTFPVGARVVENTIDFRSQPDRGVGLERAMAVTMFRDLQRAGLIDGSARLSDTPPSSGSGLSGSSYEARMVELIRDADGNGRLEIDVDRLRGSGMLRGSPTNDQVEGAITGAPRRAVEDTFLRRQTETSRGIFMTDRGSDLTTGGAVNSRGRDVQRHSSGMVLLSDSQRRAAESPVEARRVASEAIAGAQMLERASPPDLGAARGTLTRAGDDLLRAGRLDDAERVYRELGRAPHASAPVNLMQGDIDRHSAASSRFDPRRHVLQLENNGTRTEVTPRSYDTTYGELATRRLDQIAQTRSMQAVVGPSADPQNLGQVRDYFADYARTHSTAEVSTEYQRYLRNFYAHSGNNGVSWRTDVPLADRGARAQELMNGQPQDASGRRIIDCEGYGAITDRIFRDLPGADGTPRFSVMHAGRADHVISGVVDRDGSMFTVNNDATTMAPRGTSATTALGNTIANGYTDVIRIGGTPAEAQATTEGTMPRPLPGSVVWSERRGGMVMPADEAFLSGLDRMRNDPSPMIRDGHTVLIGGPTPQAYAAWLISQGR